MLLIAEHHVPQLPEKIRVYDYCLGIFQELPSRKSLKKALDKGLIYSNGKQVGTGFYLEGGEHLQLFEKFKASTPYKIDLPVVFEDEHLAIIHKPGGLLTSGNAFETAVNVLSHNLIASQEKDKLQIPHPVHRLDKATSGLLIIAKSKRAQIELGKQFQSNEVRKTYHAVVLGKIDKELIINSDVDSKSAYTKVTPIESSPSIKSDYLTLVKLEPKTGRKHQLRVHLSSQGHAILGDPIYSPEGLYLPKKGLFLCATKIVFKHPVFNEVISGEIEIPKKFRKRMKNHENMWFKGI